jgi:hypothetical protein
MLELDPDASLEAVEILGTLCILKGNELRFLCRSDCSPVNIAAK